MKIRAFGVLLAVALLAACASEVKRQAVEMNAGTPDVNKRYELRQHVVFKLDSGYQRSLMSGTEFAVAGSVAQGMVMRPTQSVLTVEGAHMHEAYAVVRDDMLVGFYLPVEKAFSPLSQATPFPLIERKP